MAGLNETEKWEEEIYQWETTDPVVGGANGIDNVPTRQLANRTKWLKARLAELVESAASILNIQKATHTSAKGAGIDAITAAFTPAIDALSDGMRLTVRAVSANTIAAPTFSPAAGVIAAKPIVKGNGKALAPGDIAGAAHWLDLHYDETLDKWILLNPATSVATVTTATDSEFADNSVKPASTGWVRGAMTAIATAAGFRATFGATGYIVFPSWLGSFIMQWGGFVSAASTFSASYPMTFPNAVFARIAVIADKTGGTQSGLTLFLLASRNTTSSIGGVLNTYDSGTYSGPFFAIGY